MTQGKVRLSKRTIDAAEPRSSSYRLWDSDLSGFGLRVSPKGKKVYMIGYRAGHGGRGTPWREYTIGQHGKLTPDEARTEAKRLLGEIQLGADPRDVRNRVRTELTVAQLCDLYLEEGAATKKASTLATDRMRIERHIKPLLGRQAVSAVTAADIERFVRDVADGKTAVKPASTRRRTDPVARGGKGTATRTTGLLGAIFTFATKRNMRSNNPVHGVKRFKDGNSHRYLSPGELGRVGVALQHEQLSAKGRAIIRLLILTGARKSEIEGLRWSEVDMHGGRLLLHDSKTGAKIVPIGPAALEVLQAVERDPASPFVFPAERLTEEAVKAKHKHFVGTPKVWLRVRELAGLSDVRLHDLRHTYASIAAAGGQSLQLIGKLLGHKDVKTTGQYAHLADDPVRQAAQRTSDAAAAALAGNSAEIISLKKA